MDYIIQKLCVDKDKIKKFNENQENINCVYKQIKIRDEIKKWTRLVYFILF